MSNNKLRRHGEFLSSKAQCFLCHFKRNTFYLEDYAARRDRENITHRITFTFTHTYISRFLSNRFIREDTNPALSLTLHITCHSNTCSFYLATGKPMRIEALYAKATEGQLISALSVAFATTFLRSSVFCSFRL